MEFFRLPLPQAGLPQAGLDRENWRWKVAQMNAIAKCDKRHRIVVRDAVPGLVLSKIAAPKAKTTVFSDGKLEEDPETGLLVWTGDLGEDPGLAVLRNRESD